MVKALVFKGDKKTKKRKAQPLEELDGHEQHKDKSLVTTNNGNEDQEDDNWVNAEAPNDITGPVVLVLPTTPPSCIMCDANGKVAVMAIENMVDDNPATAEPHDVRQVWIANRVAGTGQISFKGHHQRYLSCAKSGILSAQFEAVSPEASFVCIASTDTPGMFSIQTVREQFLSATPDTKTPGVIGNAESITFDTSLRVRMQARFKPRLKANKEQKVKEKISRKELEDIVGRKLEDEEVRKLKKARVQGNFHEAMLDVKVKGKHDKYS